MERADKKRLAIYLGIAFGFTWIFWITDALIVYFSPLIESDIFPTILFTIGGLGPCIAGLITMSRKKTIGNIGRFIFGCHQDSFFILLILLTLVVLTFALPTMKQNEAISVNAIPLIVIEAITIYGGSEELGWRGVMQPILEKKMPSPLASLITGSVWAIWHLPLWLIEGNSHQNMPFYLFAILAILLSYWLSALIDSGGSVFFCMVLHGVSNSLLSIFIIEVNWILILMLLITTLASIGISLYCEKKQIKKMVE